MRNAGNDIVFNIQKCSINDGPGIRTIVFFKGCPLHCKWCANPESQRFECEIEDRASSCIGCGACMEVCPKRCISLNDDHYVIDRNICDDCGKCSDVCYAESKKMIGHKGDPDEIMNELIKDRRYYIKSNGGVTFSGGEPLMHVPLLFELAQRCSKEGIDTAIETCGCGDFDEFSAVLPYIDHVFFDIKNIDSRRHRDLTGSGNEEILCNLKKINAAEKEITVRIPVVPGCNDTEENMKGTAEFAAGLENVKAIELLPYHSFGENKYKMLGRDYGLKGIKAPSEDVMTGYAELIESILKPAGKTCIYDRPSAKKIDRLSEGGKKSC